MRRSVIVLLLASWTATTAAQEPVDSAVARFYALRWEQPAWVFPSGISGQTDVLLDRVTGSARDGLAPADYLDPRLIPLLHRHRSRDEDWVLDSLLTRAFLLYARDLSQGRVEPATVDTQWTATRRAADLVATLSAAADDAQPGRLMEAIQPSERGYRALQAALQAYRATAERGGWPASTDLSRRLSAEGYDTSAGLRAAVRRFQTLHGLAPDGIVGPATRAALDVPAAARAEQIALNLERWRWLPRDLGERYIIVNSAAFTVELVEHDTVTWRARAIVGRVDWPTPIVSSVATGVSFRPVWTVPRVIAARELLPLIQRDPAYVRRERFHVLGDSGERRGIEVDPLMIDWSALTESTFTYQLVQDPGGSNPLGGMKLIFRNPFSVFIHDTPTRGLFSDVWRTFSHGCVRVEHAEQLIGLLLPGWSADSIHAAMTEGGEGWVPLPQPVPVHLVYWTAWVGNEGAVAFTADPYRWDDELAQALANRRARITMTGPQQ